MPSILYSTTCTIKTDLYRLRIYVDDQPNYSSIPVQLATDSLEFTPTNIPINHIKPSLTRLTFQLLDDKKINNSIPQTIALNHLLNAKQAVALPKKSLRNSNNSAPSPSLDISGRSISARTTPILSRSQDTSRTTLTPPSSRRQFSFTRLFSTTTNYDTEAILLHKTLIRIHYVDVSNSIRWTVKSLEFELDTEEVANELYANLTVCLSTLKQRPRRLLAFVNPLSGKGRARIVYDRKVLPIFEEANISVSTIYTERANHAQEYVLHENLDNFDGLVCVGGDGMFAELCHGILLRTARDEQLNIDNPHVNVSRPKLRIGIIPAGSTDAVVYGTTGLNDPVTSALQIIVGESLLIDITTVHNENGFVRFMATMLAYGFFGDIIHQSDKWRFLGPLRYDLAGFCQFIRNTSYHSELTITLSSPEAVPISHPPTINNGSGTSSVAPDCQQLISNPNTTYKSTETIDKLVRPLLRFCSRNCEQCAKEEEIDLERNSSSRQIKREGRFATINCLNMPCRCAKSKYGMSPFVHLGDGTFDLILVKRSWRTGFLRFLWQIANDGRTIEDLPNVERYRVSEVLIRPMNTNGKGAGNWACDGELINGNEIQIRVHRQALNLFASGIQFEQNYSNETRQKSNSKSFTCFRTKKSKFPSESNSFLH